MSKVGKQIVTCTAVLEHFDTVALVQNCTVALEHPGIVVEELASEPACILVLEFRNISVPQLFLVLIHTVVLVLLSIAAGERCCNK